MSFMLPRRFPGRRRRHDSAERLGVGSGQWAVGLRGLFPARGLGATAPSPIAAAIASAEGYGHAGNIPTRANNPGDLEIGDIGYGTITASGGNKITVFPNAAAGYTALQNQVNLISSGQSTAGYTPGMSIAQVGNLYAGGSSNWANNVASYLGVSPSTNFSTVAGGQSASLPTSFPVTLTTDQSAIVSPDVLASDVTALVPSASASPWLWAGLAAALGVIWWVS